VEAAAVEAAVEVHEAHEARAEAPQPRPQLRTDSHRPTLQLQLLQRIFQWIPMRSMRRPKAAEAGAAVEAVAAPQQ
jgi:hypothetical protein